MKNHRHPFLLPCAVLLAFVAALSVRFGGDEARAQVWDPGAVPIDFDLSLSKRVVFPTEREAVMMVEVAGAETAGTTRTPVVMAIVIDSSGSMEGQKIADARSAAHALIDRLADGDMASIITYDDSASTFLSNYPITSDRSAAHAAIERIRATGSTCISCGLELAYGLLSDASTRFVRRVVVLSDGNANRGVSDLHGLRMMASAALESFAVPTSTMGLGYDYNEDLMTAIANGGAGAYYFLPDSDAIATVLDREFSQLGSVVAGNVVIELTPSSGVSFGTTGTPGIERSGNQIIINLGQISSGSRRQILVPLGLPEGELGRVVSGRVSFVDAEGAGHELDAEARMERSTDAAAVEASRDARVTVRVEQVNSARYVAEALETYQRGDRERARQQLRDNAARLQQEAESLGAPALAEEANEVGRLIEVLDQAPEDGDIDGLRRHNRARSRERDRGDVEGEMYHESTIY